MTTDFTFAEAIALAFEGKTAPEWVQIFPAGPVIHARDGRVFRMLDPEGVIARVEAEERPLPIDVEHATEVRGPQGLPAPAYGWIKMLEVRNGELWGQVEWTDQGREWIESGAYRFLSPGFFYSEETLEITGLKNAGLTNNPAFNMTALARESVQEETIMDKDVLEALGLAADATAADAVAAIATLREAEVTATATALTAQQEAASSVPLAQYDEVVARLNKLEATAQASENTALEMAVTTAVEAGKITPAAKDTFLDKAKVLGLASFQEMVGNMPVILAPSGLDNGDAQGGTGSGIAGLTGDEVALCRAMGTPLEEFARGKAEQNEGYSCLQSHSQQSSYSGYES